MLIYAATIFFSAFLLFLIEPLIAKQVLPWFGGSASVWTLCLVFFQTALLAGYAYSDIVVRRFTLRKQIALQSTLLLISVATLPIIPATRWKPVGDENPSLLILGLLTVTIGLPYILLSTTSPLLQSWFVRTRGGQNPYRLFALSNAASMVALLAYPFLLEPWVATRAQALGWSVAYAIFVVMCIATGWLSRREIESVAVEPTPKATASPKQKHGKRKKVEAMPTPDVAKPASPPSLRQQAMWAILAATGSLLLLSVSNHIVRNIASIPLLWILPLAIYLSTFILAFDRARWYRRSVFVPIAAIALSVMGWAIADSKVIYYLTIQIGLFCAGLFISCMFCHGELAGSKPDPKYLTRYYFWIAVGGEGGSVLVGIVAPLVLPAHFELEAGLVLSAILVFLSVPRKHIGIRALGLVSIAFTAVCAVAAIRAFYDDTVTTKRNFYGVLRVRERTVGNDHRRALTYGTIQHGVQFPPPGRSRYPTAYYSPTSGIGRFLSVRPAGTLARRVGVIGLGIGTLAAYGVRGDLYKFYEINPDVISIAQRDFTYLKETQAATEIVLGDARLSLEREPEQNFDVLVVDAFFGDAIPVHLMTTEAMAIYRRHLKPGGVIAMHVTNQFLNLVPIVTAIADVHHLYAVHVADYRVSDPALASDWVLLSASRSSLDLQKVNDVAQPLERQPSWRLWTDDFNNLVQALK